MVPVSDEPLFSARVEPRPTRSNSIPKLICVMRCRVLLPIELLLGSAEGTDVVQRVRQGPSAARACVFPSQRNPKIAWLRFVVTGFHSQGPSVLPTPRPRSLPGNLKCSQDSWMKLGDREPLGDRFLERYTLVFLPLLVLQVLWILLAEAEVTLIHGSIVLQSHTLQKPPEL